MKLCPSIFLTVAIIFLMAGEAPAGSVRINGSTTILPIVQAVAEAFMQDHPDVNVSVSGGGSGNGIRELIDGAVDIADSSRFLKTEEVKTAVKRGVYPVPFAVAYDCIVPVVHPSNPVENITLAQLRDIYSGHIKNWKELGGPDMTIVIISRDTSSGTYEIWDERVMNGERIFPGALLQASNGAIIQTVSKNKHALGYAGIGYLDKTVKALSVDGIQGTSESVRDGRFPIARALFMFTRGWPDGDTLNFINYTIHPGIGQRYVKAAAFIPLH
jgi:phosphate transport system substrate-binding protein